MLGPGLCRDDDSGGLGYPNMAFAGMTTVGVPGYPNTAFAGMTTVGGAGLPQHGRCRDDNKRIKL